tara:strand:- start:519 stop:1118 length:600 start_codon:yes stop_codon:yes gene_type:complete
MLTDFIHRYEGVFSREECQEIIEYINFLENDGCLLHENEVSHLQDQFSNNLPSKDKYDLDLDSAHRIVRKVLPKFSPCIDDYLKTYSLLAQSRFMLYDCKVKKIPPGSGFHTWHYESAGYDITGRVFVVQLYLNDDFEGGETEFLYQNKREQAKRGDVLIFPTNFTHTHRGNSPIGGTKYLLTSWGWIQADPTDYEQPQ